MPKFRKKPVVIEAVQFKATAESFREVLGMGLTKWRPGDMGSNTFFIETLEGEHIASKSDWIIKGVNGEFYPCKPDIFKKTYEPVEVDEQEINEFMYDIE